MSPNNKATRNNTGAKVVTPVKKTSSPTAIVSPYNHPSNVKFNVLEKKQRVHNIIPLQYSDEKPFGWAFEHFFDAKEFLKSLCKNETTYLGGEEFKPFSNLSPHWVKNSSLGVNLWIICIKDETNYDESPFPVQCHILFANKIARALLHHVLWPKEQVKVNKSIIMDRSTESELTKIINSHNQYTSEITISDSILPGDRELESLI
jgi:hypothetical protein